MELNEKQNELLGLYLQGRLKGDELQNFLGEVEQNTFLKNELKIQQAIQGGIEHRNNQELRTRFKSISAESKEISKKSKVIPMRLIKMIASVAAVAILCFAAYFLLDNPSNTQSLYANYYEPSELTITRSTNLEPDIVKLKELYNSKKYDKALPLFEKIIDQDPSSSNLRLAYGNTLLICKKVNKAREQFNYIIDAKDPLYSDQSRWYLGLLELKNGNANKAIEYLKILVDDDNSDFHSEAKALLLELNELK